MGIARGGLMGTPKGCLGCQSFAVLVVSLRAKGPFKGPRDAISQQPPGGHESVCDGKVLAANYPSSKQISKGSKSCI